MQLVFGGREMEYRWPKGCRKLRVQACRAGLCRPVGEGDVGGAGAVGGDVGERLGREGDGERLGGLRSVGCARGSLLGRASENTADSALLRLRNDIGTLAQVRFAVNQDVGWVFMYLLARIKIDGVVIGDLSDAQTH